jgi:hypothetical protein
MLIVIGDSQSLAWGGYLLVDKKYVGISFPAVKSHYVGPALSHDLLEDDGSPGKWGKKIFSLLPTFSSKATAVMLTFGGVDIRTRICKQAVLSKESLSDIVSKSVDRYLAFVALLREKTPLPIFLWGLLASPADFSESWNPEFPNDASEVERNIATLLFNDCLRERSKALKGVYFFGIAEETVDVFFQTKQNLFKDDVHLGPETFGKAISSFRDIVKENNLNLPDYFNLLDKYRHRKSTLKNISGAAKIIYISSKDDEEAEYIGLVNKDPEKGYIFHTKLEDEPNIVIDIGYGAFVRKISLFNRFDGFKERAKSLMVSVGSDPRALLDVYTHRGDTFGLDDMPLNIAFNASFPSLRYIYCRLLEKQYFHLGEIQIFAETFL